MNKKLTKVVAGVCGLAGLGLLAYVLAPIVVYQLTVGKEGNFLSPIPRREEKVYRTANFKNPFDYTDAGNWFVGTETNFSNSNVGYYKLTIPSLSIENAVVAIGGQDLSESLIQYPGTALPGKAGNAVIFGHSILPQFFNPKDYIAIFSTLPTIKVGEEILVDYDGVSYKYVVEDKFEVLPTDIQILEQNNSDSFLTLVTCTPPGHPLRPKRLIVRARVVPLTAEGGSDDFRN